MKTKEVTKLIDEVWYVDGTLRTHNFMLHGETRQVVRKTIDFLGKLITLKDKPLKDI